MKYNALFALILLITGIALFSPKTAEAQSDPTFGTNGAALADVYPNDSPAAAFALPDGKILVVNNNQASGSLALFSFVRFNSNGSVDSTYGANGVVNISVPFINSSSASVLNFTRQTDGKIILVGTDNNDGLVARYNENGSLDTTFAGTGVNRPNIDQVGLDEVHAVAVQPNGKIVVAGTTRANAGFPTRIFLIRYETNGLLDSTFGDGGFITHGVETPTLGKVILQSSGKILTAGINRATGTVYRFNSNGTYDSGFTPIPLSGIFAKDLIVQADDKILVSDSVQKNDSLERTHRNVRVTRYDQNGTPDSSFGAGGSTAVDVAGYFDDFSGKMGLLPDGQIIIGANANITPNRSSITGQKYSLVRLAANGTISGKFLITNYNSLNTPDILVLPDGKILGVTNTLQSGGFDIFLARAVGVPLQTYRFKANPFDFGSFDSFINQDGKADVTVFRENQSNWYIKPIGNPFFFGLPGDIPIPADYLKDYGTEIAIFRPNTGMWYIARDFINPGQNFIALPWGVIGDIPIPFDHDGDSKADVAVFRPSDGNWYIRNSGDDSVSILRWGMNGDKPVPGDYDGDGKDDIAVWRPSNGVWYVLRSSDLQPMYFGFGLDGDIPVQEDFDADGKTDIAVWRPSNGVWYIRRSSDGNFNYLQWGTPGDIPTPSDFDGDLKTDISVWRPGNRTWYIYQSATNTQAIFPFGVNSDVPVQRRR